MTNALLIVGAAVVGWSLFVWLILPPVLAFLANKLWKLDDAGPPPPSGHGWITRKD